MSDWIAKMFHTPFLVVYTCEGESCGAGGSGVERSGIEGRNGAEGRGGLRRGGRGWEYGMGIPRGMGRGGCGARKRG